MNKDQVIVIGLHEKRNTFIEIAEVGDCLICGKPVYLAQNGVTGELEIKELRKLKLKRLMGMDCVVDIVSAFKKILETSQPDRQRTIDKLLKKERQN